MTRFWRRRYWRVVQPFLRSLAPSVLALALGGCGSSSPGSAADAPGGTAGTATTAGTGGSADAGSASAGQPSSSGSGSGGTTGGNPGSAGTGGSGVAGGANPGASQRCTTAVNAALPATAPALEVGVWKNITPASHLGYLGTPETMIAQGIAMDPCDVATLYWGTTPYQPDKGGLFKTTDGGGSWTKIGPFDEPLHVRVDPTDPKHLYVGDGVRGSTQGFWVSHDGGETWAKPEGFKAVAASIGITQSSGMDDIYDVAVDPTDFDHVLLSFHSPWSWDEFDAGAGIIESKDGGDSWNVIERQGWSQGHSIKFLYEPEQGIGDSNTWLLGTQGPGYWRTTDAGKTWKQVSPNGIAHGGGTSYYTKGGVLYASGNPKNLRSTDNGETWTELEVGGATCIFGDGKQLYSAPAWGMNPFFVSLEADGLTWEPQAGNQVFANGGPYEMVMDKLNGILYASMWEQGVWAMKVPE